jgi:uncharacterized protein YraI
MFTVLAALAGPVATSAAPANVEPGAKAVTTDRLNLRSGPSASDSVIAVMPAGAKVVLSGQQVNDYLFTTWNGQNGWAHRDWLRVESVPSETPATAVTTDRLNMRSGAALSYPVITVLPKGATVTLTGQEANGYRSISYNGRTGWAFAAYLADSAPAPAPSETATVTESLNLRKGPSLADDVVTVLPAGAVVTVTGEARNGYRSVTWSGYSGWAHADWLRFGTTTQPPPQPKPEPKSEPGPQTTGVTTDSLNLRAGPGASYNVIAVIPAGTKIVLTGETSDGYRAVTWNGKSGWAHGDWITPDGAEPTPTGTATATDNLNLRAGPATSYRVLTLIPAGTTVTLTGQTNNGFHSVTWNGYTGWAFSAFLSTGATTPPKPEPEPEPEPPPGPGTGVTPFDVTNTIVGATRGSADGAIAFARSAGAVRMDEVERYIREVYRLAPQIGFDPAILVAQSALETGYWKSDWWSLRLNPAGIGVTGDPAQNSASPTFPSGTVAARAQIAHMHAEVFGNSRPLPQVLQGVDPTYQRVFEAGWAGTIRTINDLAGTWAVDPQYGHKIVRVGREIFE